jgi:xanthine dehydrogenase YagS FAD-binding subunit
MRKFEHIHAATIYDAVAELQHYDGKAFVIAGGTDLLGCLRDGIWPEQPRAIINLKTVCGLSDIRQETDMLKIGALATLTDIAESAVIKDRVPVLAQAAFRTASPLLRNLGTLAGNICQENRCWYYRYPQQMGSRVDCVRKGGKKCLAVTGDHRYHSIFGAVKKCIAVNPSDTAPALMVLGAKIQTSKRTVPIEAFFAATNGMKATVLEDDEIVTEIQIPLPDATAKTAFTKNALRKTIDFPIVNCAACLKMNDNTVAGAAIALNAVHCNPLRAGEAEEFLHGKTLTGAVVEQAAESFMAKARPLPMNRYKVQIAKMIIIDTVMACR